MRITDITTPQVRVRQNGFDKTSYQQKTNTDITAPKMKLASLPSTAQYLSFCGGYSLSLAQTISQLDKLSEKNQGLIPPRVRELATSVLQEGNQSEDTLISIHKQAYEGLLECSTLDDAKKMFPEFEGVLSAESVFAKDGSLLADFKAGKLEYFDNDEDLALQLLKLYWAKGFSINDLRQYADNKSMAYVLRKLNIPLVDSTYGQILKFSDKEYNTRLFAEMKERRLAKLDRLAQEESGEPVYIKRGKLTAEHRRHISEGLKRYYDEHPEAILILSERQKQFYRDHPEFGVMVSRASQKAWFMESSAHVARKLIHFMKKYGHNEFDSDIIMKPMKATAKQSELLRKFWIENPKDKNILSNSMKAAWKKVNADQGKTYSIRLMPQALIEKEKQWAEKRGIEVDDNDFVEEYTPNTGADLSPTVLSCELGKEFVQSLPNGERFLKNVYREAFALYGDEFAKLQQKKNFNNLTVGQKRIIVDLSNFGAHLKEGGLTLDDYIAFYQHLARAAIYEFNFNSANKLQRCLDEAYTIVSEKSKAKSDFMFNLIMSGAKKIDILDSMD